MQIFQKSKDSLSFSILLNSLCELDLNKVINQQFKIEFGCKH